MRHFSIISLFVVALFLGCSVSPGETDENGNNGAAGVTSDGGKAATGGAGGEAGAGGVAEGGSGGTVDPDPDPAKFNCDDVAKDHFVVKVHKHDPVPPGKMAIDGSKLYPEGKGYKNLPWGNVYIADKSGLSDMAYDDGPVPAGSYFELNFGMDLDGELYETPYGEKIAVDHDTWFCDQQKCVADFICCFGSKVIGKFVNNAGEMVFNQPGKNIICVTE